MSQAHRYRIQAANPQAHLFEVELTIAEPNPQGQALRLAFFDYGFAVKRGHLCAHRAIDDWADLFDNV